MSRGPYGNGGRGRDDEEEEEKGILWKLPEVKSKQLGKIGPAFGIGFGCGVGLAIGIVGGMGVGPGIPGLQLGLGAGAGCGLGLGFGYGVGRGIAFDYNRRYSNVAKDEIGALINELVINTKKLVKATTREVDKWRRQ